MENLQPDRGQIETFVDAHFRHASPQGFVSLRSFEEGRNKPFYHRSVGLSGGLPGLIEAAVDHAYRAANYPKPIVFCPPIAVFSNKDRAREIDLVEGLTLSVECDQRPREALARLEQIIGKPTDVVRSGGKWCDPATNQVHDKLHIHWRLKVPARGSNLAKLKQARTLATKLVGGDASNQPVVHPIRWPGSWHRKTAPVLCEHEEIHPDSEIDLDTALTALIEASPREANDQRQSSGEDRQGRPWDEEFKAILCGDDYHGALARLAIKMLKAGIPDAVAVNMLRGFMDISTGPRDDRWQDRYDDIPRAVSTARQKIDGDWQKNPPHGDGLVSINAADVTMRALEWLWPWRFALGKLGLLVGLPDEGKGQIFCDMAARVTAIGEWPCGEGRAPQGRVILLTAEDDIEDTVVPRLKAAGADVSKVEIIRMVRHKGEDRMFSLLTDLSLLRKKIAEFGDVILILIDPISAYLGVGKVDSFRTTDVRAVMAPVCELASEVGAAIIGILHFNKKVDISNALLRISDSLAFGAIARHVWAAIDDEANQRKLLVKAKNNLAPSNLKALSYGFGVRDVGNDPTTGKPISAPHIIWYKHVDVSATEAMQAASENKSPGSRDAAKQFLLDHLADGPMLQKDIMEAAEANLIAEKTLRRAKDDLKRIMAKKDGPKGDWRWHLLPEV